MDKSNKKYQWKLSSLYSSDDDPQIQIELDESKADVEQFSTKWRERSDYLQDVAILKEALDEFEYIYRHGALSGKISHYLSYRYYTDLSSTKLQALMNKVQDIEIELGNQLQFFQLSLGTVDPENQQKFLSAETLQDYHYFLEQIFETARYNLSAEAETVVSSLSSLAYGNWVELLEKKLGAESREILVDGKKTEVTFSTIMSKISSTDKSERDTAAEVLNTLLEDHLDTGEQEFNNVLKYRQVMDKLRGYERPDSSSFVKGGVSPEIIDPMLKAVTEGFDIAREYYQFKAEIMGVDALEYHERNVPVGVLKTSFDWDASQDIVLKAFENVDPEFRELLQGMLDEGQVDVFPRKGKINGAYCWEGTKTAPVQILLNHTDKVNDVLTFAHEGGHAMNHIFFNRTQNSLNMDCSLFVAECCSTFMEDFALDVIKEEFTDDAEAQKILAFTNLNDVVSTIFRQVGGYNFETEIHAEFRKRGYLSHQEIGEIFTKHMDAYMGPGIKQSKGSQNWWLYWGHFRTYFYLYSYVSGLLISRVLQKKFKANQEFLKDYKKFLAMGNSLSPKDQFASIGIDVTDVNFWKEGVESIRQDLKALKAMYNK